MTIPSLLLPQESRRLLNDLSSMKPPWSKHSLPQQAFEKRTQRETHGSQTVDHSPGNSINPMSPASPSRRRLQDQDESVRIAVDALGDMHRGDSSSAWDDDDDDGHFEPSSPKTSYAPTPALSVSSSSSISTLSSPVADHRDREVRGQGSHPDFVNRVYHLPLVHSAFKAYEQGKASSRVVKYGAEMMESSVKSFSKPVMDRLPVDVNQLEDFACRQLDRIGVTGKPSERIAEQAQHTPPTPPERRLYFTTKHQERENAAASGSRVQDHVQRPKTPKADMDEREDNEDGIKPTSHPTTSPTSRSRWQSVLLEAGGISAALSDENMRRLKYCLHWLQYATRHIDAQILILRDVTAHASHCPPPESPEAVTARMRRLANARRDVINTVRQVVEVVSKYAGGALPEPARTRVRGFILTLPQRWASATRGDAAARAAARGRLSGRYTARRERGTGSQPNTPGSSRASSPTPSISSPRINSRSASRPLNGHSHDHAQNEASAAQRILTLAIESLDMLRGVTAVVTESLDRAEIWVERFRNVGMRRGSSTAPAFESDVNGFPLLPHHDDDDDDAQPPSPFLRTGKDPMPEPLIPLHVDPIRPPPLFFSPPDATLAHTLSTALETTPSPGTTFGTLSLSTPRLGLGTLPEEKTEEPVHLEAR